MSPQSATPHKGISWQTIACGGITLLMLILTGLIGGIWSDVSKIDVLENKIETLSSNKNWMRKMQGDIDELQKAVWKSHPDHN